MNAADAQILLCTNGAKTSRPALTYGIWLAGLLKAPVVLLGVLEDSQDRKDLEDLMQETTHQLQANNIAYRSATREGRASVQISEYAAGGDFFAIVGPLGRPTWRRWVRGRTFRRLLARIESPLIYVPVARLSLNHILLCMGGLGYAFSMEHTILHLAQRTEADLTLLNVVEPVNLDYPIAHEVHEHWENLVETDTPLGKNLHQAMQAVVKAGLGVNVKIRHGNVVKEILEEVHEGDYDLVGLGSPYSAHSLRHIYMPNVTAEVAESIDRPVLTVRSGFEIEL
jgi:nucleotide-binding universal stress UspA family protein